MLWQLTLIRNNLRNCAKGSRAVIASYVRGPHDSFPMEPLRICTNLRMSSTARLSIAVSRRDVEPSCTDLLESVWRQCSQIVSVTWCHYLRVTSKKVPSGGGRSSICALWPRLPDSATRLMRLQESC